MTKTILGLTFTGDAATQQWQRGSLRVFQHRHGKWLATAPGCSACARTPAMALDQLRTRVTAAGLALKVGGAK